MPSERDLFANFERMRREMDALFGARSGFAPAVDVYLKADRAVVRVELAGVDPADVVLEIRGRELILAGVRHAERADRRAYQQLEIERGAFRRVVALDVDVDPDRARAAYTDGMLTVELPFA